MSQPITSKLAIVAHCMDSFTRAENDALTSIAVDQNRQIHLLVIERDQLAGRLRLAFERINELEEAVENQLDHAEQLTAYIARLEASILDCPHPTAHGVRAAQRRLDYEMIDMTTEEELSESE